MREIMMVDRNTGTTEPYGRDPAWHGFLPLDARSRNGASFLVGNPKTGDMAKAWWAGDMWALYCGPDYETVEQLDFEPTHYKELQA